MRAFLEPIFRADFTLFDTYRWVEQTPLHCPIAAFGGECDPALSNIGLSSQGFQI